MENEKDVQFESEEDSEDTPTDSAQRARNRTVMLTPDVTGEMRARLAQELQSNDPPVASGGFKEPPAFGMQASEPAASGFSGFGGGAPAEPTFGQQSTPGFGSARSSNPVPPPPEPMHAPVSGDRIVWVKKGPVIGFLVSFDRDENGEVFPLRTGRLIVTSEASSTGNFLIVTDGTVSPMHAILRMTPTGEIQVLDQLSEHGTQIKRFGGDEMQELSGDKGTLEHGDLIYFGERKFYVCVLVRDDE